LSLLLSRMTEFSPVTITLFTSTVLIADVSELGHNTPIIAEGYCQPTLRMMVCPQWERRSAHHRRGDYGDRSVEDLDDAIDLAAISPSSRSAGDALSQIRIDCVDEIAATCLFLGSEDGGFITGQTINVNGAGPALCWRSTGRLL